MKPLLFSILSLMVFNAYSQQVELQLSQLPVKDGFIYKNEKHKNGWPVQTDGVYINSANDSCFATADGEAVSTFNLGDQFAVVVRTGDETYVTYSNFKQLAIKRGDTIRRGMFLGSVNSRNNDFSLLFIMSDSEGKPLPHDKHLAYLQSNTSLQRL